jgi:hypothetical protein
MGFLAGVKAMTMSPKGFCGGLGTHALLKKGKKGQKVKNPNVTVALFGPSNLFIKLRKCFCLIVCVILAQRPCQLD